MSENWLDDLPEGLREAPYLAKATSVEDALGKLQHAAKVNGTSIRIPLADASDDDKSAFYAKLHDVEGVARLPMSDDEEGLNTLMGKLGTPAEHTDYKLPEITDFSWDETMGEDLRKYALEAGMTVNQFTKFANKIGNQELEASTLSGAEMTTQQTALRQDWGDTLEPREALIRGWMQMSEAPSELQALMEKRELPLSTMNWLHGIANQFKGDVKPVGNDGKTTGDEMQPLDAKIALQAVLTDLRSMKDSDPRYRPLQQKMVQLQGVAMGKQSA
jgi:hypothetical protein